MRLLPPYDSFQIDTALPLDKAIKSLRLNVDKQKLSFFDKPSPADFHGTVNQYNFKIVRKTLGNNSFVPIVTGDFIETKAGTIIQIEMGVRPFVVLWAVALIGMTGLPLLTVILDFIFNLDLEISTSIGGVLGLIGTPVIFLSIAQAIFWSEITYQKEMLTSLYERAELDYVEKLAAWTDE